MLLTYLLFTQPGHWGTPQIKKLFDESDYPIPSSLDPSDAEDVQRPPAGAGAGRLALPAVHGADDGSAATVRVVRHHRLPLRRTISLRNAPHLEVGKGRTGRTGKGGWVV